MNHDETKSGICLMIKNLICDLQTVRHIPIADIEIISDREQIATQFA